MRRDLDGGRLLDAVQRNVRQRLQWARFVPMAAPGECDLPVRPWLGGWRLFRLACREGVRLQLQLEGELLEWDVRVRHWLHGPGVRDDDERVHESKFDDVLAVDQWAGHQQLLLGAGSLPQRYLRVRPWLVWAQLLDR